MDTCHYARKLPAAWDAARQRQRDALRGDPLTDEEFASLMESARMEHPEEFERFEARLFAPPWSLAPGVIESIPPQE